MTLIQYHNSIWRTPTHLSVSKKIILIRNSFRLASANLLYSAHQTSVLWTNIQHSNELYFQKVFLQKHQSYMIINRDVANEMSKVSSELTCSYCHSYIGKSIFEYKRIVSDLRQLIAHSRNNGIFIVRLMRSF